MTHRQFLLSLTMELNDCHLSWLAKTIKLHGFGGELTRGRRWGRGREEGPPPLSPTYLHTAITLPTQIHHNAPSLKLILSHSKPSDCHSSYRWTLAPTNLGAQGWRDGTTGRILPDRTEWRDAKKDSLPLGWMERHMHWPSCNSVKTAKRVKESWSSINKYIVWFYYFDQRLSLDKLWADSSESSSIPDLHNTIFTYKMQFRNNPHIWSALASF